jgi:protein involved in polysaccharide export with SLBB domain
MGHLIGVEGLSGFLDRSRVAQSDKFVSRKKRVFKKQLIAAASIVLTALIVSARPSYADPVIHDGDRVAIKVYNHPELSSTIAVDSRGYLAMPLVGPVPAAGSQPGELAAKIRNGLKPFMHYPAVDAQIAGEGASVFVSGGPGGVIAYQPGQTLSAALSQIKSVDGVDILHSRVDLTRVGVQRDQRSLGTFDTIALSGRGDGGPVLAAGDTVVLVDKSLPVRIDGDITRPGTTFLNDREPLSDAIDQLGGLTATSANAQVAVTRDGVTELHALGDPVFREPAHEGDRVVIPTAPRITIAGMVSAPGQVVLKSDFTLLSALYNAGGPNKWANLKIVQVVDKQQRSEYDITKLTHGDLSQNPVLHDGDVVFVPEGHKIDLPLGTLFSAIYAGRALIP